MIRFVLVSVLTFAFVVGWLPAARSYGGDVSKISQLPSSPTPATPSQPNLPGVARLGNIEVTPVMFEGQQLFTIAEIKLTRYPCQY